MTGCFEKSNENVTIFFRVNNKKLLEKSNKLWEKVKKLMRIDFESKPVYADDDKYIKTKIKIYAGSMFTNFRNKKVPKGNATRKCLSIIMLDSVIRVNKKYYPQSFLEECKYVQEKIKNENYTDDDLKSDSKSNEETEYDTDECDE